MATYIFGDVQGCYDILQQLLDRINYDPAQDRLGFVGDLVNRGPDSLSTLRFIKSLDDPLIVLGNHDFALLALSQDAIPAGKSHNLHPIMEAEDSDAIINWLRQQPVLRHISAKDKNSLGLIMVHAGIPPIWNLHQALQYSNEVADALRGDEFPEFMRNLFGSEPRTWNESLTGWDRLRYIVNSFTRMRFCMPDGSLDFAHKTTKNPDPTLYKPWFDLLQPSITEQNILCFGHWAALQGNVPHKRIIGLDTGAVWAGALSAYRVEDGKIFSISAQ